MTGPANGALANTKFATYWTDQADAPALEATSLVGAAAADLVIVGGGFSGLWAALQALEDIPGLRVAVLEAETCGFGASTRNGGFCDASLTHGLHNGLAHWPKDMSALVRLGLANLDDIEATLDRHHIDCAFERTGEIDVALAPWQLAELSEGIEDYRDYGLDVEMLDQAAVQALVASPTYVGAMVRRKSIALVDPARLVWGLRAAVESLGGTVHEQSKVEAIEPDGSSLRVRTSTGHIDAARVVVATNAYPGPVRRQRNYVIPVYDHVLMTEPLSATQMDSIGWTGREGIGDAANQFHYYRLTKDNRILWGGYEATYHFGNGIGVKHEDDARIHGLLADHFFETFPQLEGASFTHRWAGPIGTTTKFSPTWGTDHDGRLAWVAGYTGLGVGASRFGARVALDLVFDVPSERVDLAMVRRKPMPFPPEPLRSAGVHLTKRAIQRSDARDGKRGLWLRALDRFGVGFDS